MHGSKWEIKKTGPAICNVFVFVKWVFFSSNAIRRGARGRVCTEV